MQIMPMGYLACLATQFDERSGARNRLYGGRAGENTFEVLGEVADQGRHCTGFLTPVLEKAAEAQKAIYSKSK